jgi:GNAT superfamily N-acetyltransferase
VGLLAGLWSALRAMGERADRFSVRFSVGRFELALWERPGRWCDDATLARIVHDLRTVASAHQQDKGIPEYGALRGDRQDLATRVVTLVYTRQGQPVGFSALTWFDLPLGPSTERVLHLGLTFIDPEFQRQGLPAFLYGVASFLLLFKRGLRGFWISNVSQVPAVIGAVSHSYAQCYPHYAGKNRQTFTHLLLARAIMKHHRSAFGVSADAPFDEARQIIADAYRGGSDELKKTFEEAPKHRIEAVNEFCRKWLDYPRGDDFLQIARCTLASGLHFLRGKLPPGSVVQMVYRALVLVAFASIVPVVKWLVPPPEGEEDALSLTEVS